MMLIVVEPHIGIEVLHFDITSGPMIGENAFALFFGSNPYRFSSVESAVSFSLGVAERKYLSVLSVDK